MRTLSLHWLTGGIPHPSLYANRSFIYFRALSNVQATAAYLSSSNVGDIESVPDSAMINGVGRYVGGPEMAWARINVTQGQRYRFRIVNTSGIAHYRFAIQGHSLTVRTKELHT